GSPTLAGAVNSIRVGQIEIPTAEQGALAVYYHHDDTNLYVSAAQLLEPTQLASLRPLIEGHIVLVGATATGLLDTRVSSLGESLPGVAVHAQALEQVMSGQFLSRPEWVADFEMVLVAAAGLAFSILAGLWRPLPLIGALLATLAALAGLTSWFFLTQNLLFDFTFPFTALVAVFLVTLAFKLLVTERHGRALRTAFSRYVASPVLEQIERNPQTLKLGGEQREVTVMFADIKNFTPLTEKLPPKELVSCVNRILQASTAAILARNGTLDKYIGDAVMAFWNAPVEMQDHQYQAALAALDIHKAVAALNADPLFAAPLKARNLWPISLRIGLASGPATVGNMGSRDRFDYSVLGETVNTAARAEAACKEVAADTLLAGALIGKSATLATLDAGKRQFRGAGQLRQCHAIFSAEKDEEHRLADMTLYGFQSGTRMIQPPHGEAYARFFAALPQRRADYGMK
ncbi:MAG: adenylate/guanylate cyclase domain-containing protein, partial [Alphaproteobacteria bacterium]|nr:adenylate/guanylate cyclase domain-containing protein [Alphaproteobacteria bacterium]